MFLNTNRIGDVANLLLFYDNISKKKRNELNNILNTKPCFQTYQESQ